MTQSPERRAEALERFEDGCTADLHHHAERSTSYLTEYERLWNYTWRGLVLVGLFGGAVAVVYAAWARYGLYGSPD